MKKSAKVTFIKTKIDINKVLISKKEHYSKKTKFT